MGQESRHSSAGSSAHSFMRLQFKMLAGLRSHSEAQVVMGLFLNSVVVGSIKFLACHQTQGLCFLLVVGCKLFSAPCHVGLSIVVAHMTSGSSKAARK